MISIKNGKILQCAEQSSLWRKMEQDNGRVKEGFGDFKIPRE